MRISLRELFYSCIFICCLISEGNNHFLQTLHLTRWASGSGKEEELVLLLLDEDLLAAFLGFFFLCSFSMLISGEDEAFLFLLLFAFLIFVCISSSSDSLDACIRSDSFLIFRNMAFENPGILDRSSILSMVSLDLSKFAISIL